jgi:tungstate transport system ATP-binding protein
VTALLEIRDLLVRRDGRDVLEIDHLAVQPGEVLAAVGPNGAGKTTFFLAVALLLKPQSGKIEFGGQRVHGLPETAYRRRMALVLQEPLLFDATVYQNATIGLKFRGLGAAEVKRRATHWLGRMGIAHLAGRSAHKLSGGEAQRVSLARAFVLEPELLLLDEPFSGLDNATRIRLLDDLRAVLAETGTTAIFITHDLREAARLATHVAVFLDGKMLQAGKAKDVFERPSTPQVAAFLGTVEA